MEYENRLGAFTVDRFLVQFNFDWVSYIEI